MSPACLNAPETQLARATDVFDVHVPAAWPSGISADRTGAAVGDNTRKLPLIRPATVTVTAHTREMNNLITFS